MVIISLTPVEKHDTYPFFRNAFRWLSQLSRLWVHTLSVGLVAAVVLFKYSTNPQLSCTILYLLPVVLATWFLGFANGISYALLSVIACIITERLWNKDHTITAVCMVNNIGRLGVLSVITYLLHTIKSINGMLAIRVEKRTAALQQSQAMLQSVTEVTTDAVYVKDTQGRYLMLNSAASRFVGKPVEEVLGTDDRAHFSADVAIQLMEIDRQVIASNGPKTYEEHVNTATGATTFLSTKRPIHDQQGKVIGVFGISRDITERKQAELALAANEQFLRALIENSPLGILAYKASGQTISANEAAAKIIGSTIEKLNQKNFRQLPSWKNSNFLTMADKALDSGQIQIFEGHTVSTYGVELWASCRFVPFHFHGEPHLLLLLEDISNRKRVEETLRLQSEITRNLAEGVVLVRNSDHTIVNVNPKFEQMFGYAPGELLGKPITIVNSPSERPAEDIAVEILGKLAQDGQWSGEIKNRKKDGSEFWCRATVSGFQHSNHGKVWISVHTNITDQKMAEQALLEISDHEQARIGQDLHDGLCQQLIGIAFASNTLSQKLAQRGIPEETDAQRISKMLDEAITQAHTTARGLFPVQLDAEGLTSALHELAESTRRQTRSDCWLDCPDPVHISTPNITTHLFRIALEAVNNAVKHGRPKQIVIRLTQNEELIELAVLDDGCGIPDPLPLNHGLGINIMAYRARTIGGRLRVFRRPEGGTAVTCNICRQKGPAVVNPQESHP